MRLEYREKTLPVGDAIEIRNASGNQVAIQVLSVEQVEGNGQDNWLNHWRYVMVWR